MVKRIFISFCILLLAVISCGKGIQLNTYPIEEFKKVVAYKMTGENGQVIENGKISTKATGVEKQLTYKEIKQLLDIFQDTSTYGDTTTSCFEPHLGFVFYGNNNNIVGHATICLLCNKMITKPNIGASVFSEEGVSRLFQLEEKIFVNL